MVNRGGKVLRRDDARSYRMHWPCAARLSRAGVCAVAASAGLGLVAAGAEAAAPTAPTLVWPASGATLNADAPQLFTIRAIDPDGDAYVGSITVRDAATGAAVYTFSTTPAASGQRSSGSPGLPLAPGNYTWTASARDLVTNGPQAPLQAFTIAGASDAGGGVVTGSMSFAQPLPPAVNVASPLVGHSCAPSSFDVSAISAAGVVSFAQTAFAGPVRFAGAGASPCETAGLGAGSLELSAHGVGVASATLDCPELSGDYTRVGSELNAVLSGPCAINGRADSVTLELRVALVPTSGGATSAISATRVDGVFVVTPST